MTVSDRTAPPATATVQQDQLPWHARERHAVEQALGTSDQGLQEAEATERLKRYGSNELEDAEPISYVAILLHQFRSPLIYILVVAALVTAAIGEYIDTGVIVAVLVLNAIIGFTQERRAEESVRALMQLVTPRAHVLRGGREQDIESRSLVPGDVVLLESGSHVPADLRLLAVTALAIDESLLTGESLPVAKTTGVLSEDTVVSDRTNMAFMGTVVNSGRTRGYVVATGAATELGKIAERIKKEERLELPLQRRMTRFAHLVAVFVGVSVAAAFVIGVALGETPGEMFMVAVALAVAAVPEGLPVVFTITLALGVRRMARRHAIIRRLPAVETLGSTTVIGSDKTGTLTENRMTVRDVWAGGETVDLSDGTEPPQLDARSLLDRLPEDPLTLAILTGVLTNEAVIGREDDGTETRGDPTETALLRVAARLGIEADAVRAAYVEESSIPFESERQFSASFRRLGDRHLVFVKGAPERVLEMCDRVAGATLNAGVVHEVADAMAQDGLRVLAVAYGEIDSAPAAEHPDVPSGLTCVGLQGMLDPPREGVREAIAGCHEAGIRVVMITGDHAATARSIGAALNIATPDAPVLTGSKMGQLDDDELRRRVSETSIYARVSPEDKLRVVRAYQSHGEIVAVTGDGVNDAPALKAANIGVAMGQSGTDVARAAADMVLTDDNFVSIYAAVEEGRVTFDNVRKVTFFLISTGVASIVTILGALLLRWPIPFVPAQLLWMNLVTKGLQDVALAFEPGEPGVVKRGPRPASEGIMSPLLWERTVVVSVVMTVGTLALFRWELDQTGSLAQAQTVALTTMVLFQMFHVGNSRSEFESVFTKSPLSNPFLLIATSASLIVHAAALYMGPTQFVLRVEPVDLNAWTRIVAVSLTIVGAIELHKLARRGSRPDDGAARR
jgi:magnesium-transporting ATPase (P-type)